MNLADESHGHRQFGQPGAPTIHRTDVVHHFFDVAGASLTKKVSFGGEEVLKRALGSLNLARKHGLLADVHVDEEVGIRQRLDGAIQSAQRAVGLGEQPLQIASNLNGWCRRQASGHEGPVALRLSQVPACSSLAISCTIVVVSCVYHGRATPL